MSSVNLSEVKVPVNIEKENTKTTESVKKSKSPELVTATNKDTSETIDDTIMLTLEALNSSSDDISKNIENLEEKTKSSVSEPITIEKKQTKITVKTTASTANGSNTNTNNSKLKPAPRLLNKEVAAKNNASKRLNTKFNSTKSIDSNEDLVAILEGKNPNDSETEEYQILDLMQNEDDHNGNDNQKTEDKSSVVTLMTKEQERKIALAQMSIYTTKKSKPATRKVKSPAATTELLTSLVSDWSDGEKDTDLEKKEKPKNLPIKKTFKKDNNKTESTETVAATSTSNVTISTIADTGIVPFKRSRIIKKKIIWDPDAPETQFSYASLLKKSTTKQTVPKKIDPSSSPTPTVPLIKIEASNNNNTSPVQKGRKTVATQPLVKLTQIEPTKLLNGKKRKASTSTNIPTTITTLTGNAEQKSNPTAKVISSIEIKSPKIAKVEKTIANELQQVPASEKSNKKDAPVTPAKKRGLNKTKPQSTASSSWDYVYKQQTDDAMIIRRRSNSSYSSTTSPRRLSLEQQIPATSIKKPATGNKTGGVKRKQDNFQFAKPENKKNGLDENNLSNNSIAVDIKKQPSRKSSRTSTISDITEIENISTSSVTGTITANTPTQSESFAEITVKKIGKIGQIILNPKETKIKNCFSSMLMNKIVSQLDALQKDNNCKIVVISSKNANFCQGIDISSLVATTADKRKLAAQDLSKSLRNLIESLASFPKPLIASVSGSIINLGVTLLPLFDIVVGSEKSSFETSYTKIGQIPEGFCVLSIFNLTAHSSVKKMLYLCEKLNAAEANQSDLITKLSQNDNVDDEAIEIAKEMSLLSHQTYASMKAHRKRIELTELSKLLDEEQKLLIQHWTSAECQEKFKEYMKNEQW